MSGGAVQSFLQMLGAKSSGLLCHVKLPNVHVVHEPMYQTFIALVGTLHSLLLK